MPDFKELHLNPKIQDALEAKGYVTPTPIQQQSIPHLLKGKDLLGIAQTGTGKTAAFSLPIIDNLAKSNIQVRPNNMRTLILTPTRELASQIADNIKLYSKGLGLRHIVLFGGVSINNQIKELKRGFDIVVATPGRFLDLKNQGHIRMSQVETFVLDEADRMLDMGFIHDVKKVIAALPDKRQTLLFSATMPRDIASLAQSMLKDPVTVEVTPQATTVEKIDQKIHLVEKGNKPALLKSILKGEDAKTVLIFSKTKHGANRIVDFLEKESIKSAAIHGNKSQNAREKALNDFRKGTMKVLVATDIAARGIDIPSITHVINYDIPQDPASYVHRIGRTARAGRNGVAISFCDRSEKELLREVEKTIKYNIPIDDTHAFHGVKAAPGAQELDRRPPRGGSGRSAQSRNSNSRNSKGRNAQPVAHFSKNRRNSKSAFPEDGVRASGDSSSANGIRDRRPQVGFKEKSGGKDARFSNNRASGSKNRSGNRFGGNSSGNSAGSASGNRSFSRNNNKR